MKQIDLEVGDLILVPESLTDNRLESRYILVTEISNDKIGLFFMTQMEHEYRNLAIYAKLLFQELFSVLIYRQGKVIFKRCFPEPSNTIKLVIL